MARVAGEIRPYIDSFRISMNVAHLLPPSRREDFFTLIQDFSIKIVFTLQFNFLFYPTEPLLRFHAENLRIYIAFPIVFRLSSTERILLIFLFP